MVVLMVLVTLGHLMMTTMTVVGVGVGGAAVVRMVAIDDNDDTAAAADDDDAPTIDTCNTSAMIESFLTGKTVFRLFILRA